MLCKLCGLKESFEEELCDDCEKQWDEDIDRIDALVSQGRMSKIRDQGMDIVGVSVIPLLVDLVMGGLPFLPPPSRSVLNEITCSWNPPAAPVGDTFQHHRVREIPLLPDGLRLLSLIQAITSPPS